MLQIPSSRKPEQDSSSLPPETGAGSPSDFYVIADFKKLMPSDFRATTQLYVAPSEITYNVLHLIGNQYSR